MAGLVPAIHAFLAANAKNVDARDKHGHDEWCGRVGWAKRNVPTPSSTNCRWRVGTALCAIAHLRCDDE
jgi:hypothetical protein